MAVTRNSLEIGQPTSTPPDPVKGNAILLRPMRGGNSLPIGNLGQIAGTQYGAVLQQAYQLALKHTEDLSLNGMVEVNRLVSSTAAETIDDYAAVMTVSIMAMFRSEYIPENWILLGNLDTGGRIQPTLCLAEKKDI